MSYKFTATPEVAHQLTKESKKHDFYFRTLTKTNDVDNVVCEVTKGGFDYIYDNFIPVDFYTYDVVFNDSEFSNSKGWKMSKEGCEDYIKLNNGTNESYFADYKGGIVEVVCNETGESVYQEEVR